MDEDDDDWGMLVWLAMTTGMRRGELCALRFSSLDLDGETINISRNWVNGKEHRERVKTRVEALGQTFNDELFVFTSLSTKDGRAPDHTAPYSSGAVTQRYADMAARIETKTHLHALRHYSATELLTAGIDLRTVAGRLGHGGGGTTTLRVYAAWVAAADRKAAETWARVCRNAPSKARSKPRK